MKNFIDITQFSRAELNNLLTRAQQFTETTTSSLLGDRLIANLFFEPSTRTRCSFAIAAKKLGAHVIEFDIENSATQKGETDIDTLLNLQAMGVEAFVIRHQQNNMATKMAAALGKNSALINAGCGTQQHPSQALLDMLTIQQHKSIFDHLCVAIIGDIRHSRVAHSDIAALQLLNTGEIRLIGPDALLPENIAPKNIETFTNIEEGLQDVDVIITLRLQHERVADDRQHNVKSFQQQYRLTTARLQLAKQDAIVMHPGPMHRGVEISAEVINSQQAVILQQATNGVAARMAILAHVFAI